MTTIDITSELSRFKRHLENNPRTIFSAKFGDGKTYFLNEYMRQHKMDTLFVVLHPINYSVAANEDVFEYIKRDILVDLARRKEFKEVDWKEVAKTLFSYDNLLETNKELADALPDTFFSKPSEGMIQKYQLSQINEDHEIWTSILDLKNHPELREPLKELGEKIDEYSLLTLGWEPVIKQKNDVKVIAIKVWYKLLDEGNPDEIGDVKSIESKVKRNKKGG